MEKVTHIDKKKPNYKYLKMLRDLYQPEISMTYQGGELLIVKKIKGQQDQVLWLTQDEINQVEEFIKCQQKHS